MDAPRIVRVLVLPSSDSSRIYVYVHAYVCSMYDTSTYTYVLVRVGLLIVLVPVTRVAAIHRLRTYLSRRRRYVFFRPFSVQKIPHSNLMLLVVDTLCPCGTKQLDISPREVIDGKECDLKYEFMYRRRTGKCVNYHPEVKSNHFSLTIVTYS